MTFPLTVSVSSFPLVKVGFGQSAPSRQGQVSQDVFDLNHVQYDPNKVYAETGKLSLFQKLCTFLIKNVYHPLTRGKYGIYKIIPIRCMFKEAGKLSCSEFTLAAIQQLGPVRGIFQGLYRILRCNPINSVFLKHTEDPVFRRSA